MIQWTDDTHAACKRSTEAELAASYLDAVHAGNTAEIARIEAELDALDEREAHRDLGRAALYYARTWGWPVFPLIPGTKEPLTKHGFKDATTDPDQIAQWWRAAPDANIGLPTGGRFDVLDVDWLTTAGLPTGAQEAWPMLRDSGALPDVHGVAMTARGGLHIYLEPTGAGNHARMGKKGLDYRGQGGYVVGAPSRMPVGRIIGRWSWAVRPSPTLTGMPVGAP